jgi:hypothetical protein
VSRKKLALYGLLVVAALIIPILFGVAPSTQAGLFQSPPRNYLPMIANNFFGSPLPTPAPQLLYLPLVLRAW